MQQVNADEIDTIEALGWAITTIGGTLIMQNGASSLQLPAKKPTPILLTGNAAFPLALVVDVRVPGVYHL